MSRFVLAVSPSGVCSFRSSRSFRVLSGGAVRACSLAVLRRVRSPRSLPVVVASPVLPSASVSGSALFLSSPAFLSPVASGACPVAVSLSVFRWPVRSAVLLSCLRALSSWRVRSAVAGGAVPRGVLSGFVRSALVALGFSCSGRFLSPRARSRLVAFLGSCGCRSVVVPAFPVVRVLPSALCSAFSSLSRCLAWLSRRASPSGRVGCPPALRPALSRLVLAVVAVLG